VTFIENHDMPRFLSICPSHADLELATVLLLTLRGIPCLLDVNYVGGSRQLRRRVTPGPPPAMAGGGDSEK
jgi:glycosidase